MAIYGETLNVNAPIISVVGSISGSFTITGTDTPFDVVAGVDSTSVTKVDHARIIKYDEALPTIRGTATVTITAAGGTQVHYTLTGKAPHSKGRNANTDTTISNRDRSASVIYTAPFVLTGNRPGAFSPTILKVRAWKLVSGVVSPNEKSKLIHVRFMIDSN